MRLRPNQALTSYCIWENFLICFSFLFHVPALNNGCMEGEEVICPDSVLKALSSHGWIIPSEQQVSKNIVTISKRALPLTQGCSASEWARLGRGMLSEERCLKFLRTFCSLIAKCQLKVARYSFSGPIPLKFEHKLRRHKQSFGKIATTVVLDEDENLLWSGLQRHRSCHSYLFYLQQYISALGTVLRKSVTACDSGSFFLQ